MKRHPQPHGKGCLIVWTHIVTRRASYTLIRIKKPIAGSPWIGSNCRWGRKATVLFVRYHMQTEKSRCKTQRAWLKCRRSCLRLASLPWYRAKTARNGFRQRYGCQRGCACWRAFPADKRCRPAWTETGIIHKTNTPPSEQSVGGDFSLPFHCQNYK